MKLKALTPKIKENKASVKFIYPPRPKGRILPNQLSVYEQQRGRWLVQRKFNGTRTLIHISKDKDVVFINRHCQIHKKWSPPSFLIDELLSLDLEDKEYWFDSELLHEKTTAYKNKIVLFDVLHIDKYLFGGPTLLDRYKILYNICGCPTKLEPSKNLALQVTKNIWLAENFFDNFYNHYNEFIHYDEIEGLVLKKISSTLDHAGSKEYEIGWQIRCREPHKNYGF